MRVTGLDREQVEKSVVCDCTKTCQVAVYGLQSIDFTIDTGAQFLLTGKIERVKRQSFFGTFCSFADWCSVRGSSEVTILLRKQDGRQARVYSNAPVEENRNDR
jgi:hypothetical protein